MILFIIWSQVFDYSDILYWIGVHLNLVIANMKATEVHDKHVRITLLIGNVQIYYIP